MKLSVLLNEHEAERLQQYCSDTGHKKSPLIARLIRDHLAREGYIAQELERENIRYVDKITGQSKIEKAALSQQKGKR